MRLRRGTGVKRAIVGAIVGVATIAACGSAAGPRMVLVCETRGAGCNCFMQNGRTAESAGVACNQAAFPGTTCCATSTWGQNGSECGCSTNAIGCGIVPGYFQPSEAGGAPLPGCVCSAGTFAQVARCEPGGWTSPPSALGVCCFYPAGFQNEYGGPWCACGPSSVCAPGTTPVASCSAANFAPPPAETCPGEVLVKSCYYGEGGAPGGGASVADGAPAGD